MFLTIPTTPANFVGLIQSHPYVLAWADGSDVTLLIQKHTGFSNDLFFKATSDSLAIVDGPYGQFQELGVYDKVLFIASGIGIAAHLLMIKHLLEAHETQSVRARRITLLWFLETKDQEQWASSFLQRLQDIDRRHVFTLAIFEPAQRSTSQTRFYEKTNDRFFRTDQSLDLDWYIDRESSADAGNMAVSGKHKVDAIDNLCLTASVCGTPRFEEAVRHGVRASARDIYLFWPGFCPQETEDSRASQHRYS